MANSKSKTRLKKYLVTNALAYYSKKEFVSWKLISNPFFPHKSPLKLRSFKVEFLLARVAVSSRNGVNPCAKKNITLSFDFFEQAI